VVLFFYNKHNKILLTNNHIVAGDEKNIIFFGLH
jgi:S1-C subfamily serine protease